MVVRVHEALCGAGDSSATDRTAWQAVLYARQAVIQALRASIQAHDEHAAGGQEGGKEEAEAGEDGVDSLPPDHVEHCLSAVFASLRFQGIVTFESFDDKGTAMRGMVSPPPHQSTNKPLVLPADVLAAARTTLASRPPDDSMVAAAGQLTNKLWHALARTRDRRTSAASVVAACFVRTRELEEAVVTGSLVIRWRVDTQYVVSPLPLAPPRSFTLLLAFC